VLQAPRLDNVHVDVGGQVATVELNRPEQRNALSAQMLSELCAADREFLIETAVLHEVSPPRAAALGRHDAGERLRSVQLPTHVIGAEHDILVPVWKSQELAELIPGAKLTVLDGVPHGVNVEGAERFNSAVLDFIAERAAAPA
jgi:pimeloyl-ACP methyl ester carboxylesterase